MSNKPVTITVQLTDDEAQALAQFVKRAGFSECRANAVSEDEAYRMVHGLNAVQDGLADAGYAPR